MLHEFIFDAFIGKRTGLIEAERLEIARQHFHRRDPAILDRLDEFCPGGEGEFLAAPQAKPLGIGKIVHRGGAGRRDIDDARVG